MEFSITAAKSTLVSWQSKDSSFRSMSVSCWQIVPLLFCREASPRHKSFDVCRCTLLLLECFRFRGFVPFASFVGIKVGGFEPSEIVFVSGSFGSFTLEGGKGGEGGGMLDWPPVVEATLLDASSSSACSELRAKGIGEHPFTLLVLFLLSVVSVNRVPTTSATGGCVGVEKGDDLFALAMMLSRTDGVFQFLGPRDGVFLSLVESVSVTDAGGVLYVAQVGVGSIVSSTAAGVATSDVVSDVSATACFCCAFLQWPGGWAMWQTVRVHSLVHCCVASILLYLPSNSCPTISELRSPYLLLLFPPFSTIL